MGCHYVETRLAFLEDNNISKMSTFNREINEISSESSNTDFLPLNTEIQEIPEPIRVLGASDTEIPQKIGYGFDSRTGMAKVNNCFANSKEIGNVAYSNPSGKINLTKSMSSEEVSSLTNISMNGSLGFGWFSASVSASYMKETINTRYSSNFNFAQTFSYDASYNLPEGYAEDLLSSTAKKALEKDGLDGYTKLCGDTYISNGKAGGVLLVTVGIEFQTASQKQQFDTSADVKINSIFSISAAFKSQSASSTANGVMTIKALQLGGDPSKLARLLGQSGNYNIVSCSPTNTQTCDGVLGDIINYAQTDFPNGVDLKNPNTLYLFQTHTETYYDLGVSEELPILSAEAKAAQEYVVAQVQDDRAYSDYLIKYMQTGAASMIDNYEQDVIREAISDYQTLVNAYSEYRILRMCYGINAEKDCVTAQKYIKEKHQKLNKAVDIAKKLSVVYVSRDYRIFVSNRYTNFVTPEFSYGTFLLYDRDFGRFDTSGYCYVDFSPDNRYFKNDPTVSKFPNILGYFIQCYNWDLKKYTNFIMKRVRFEDGRALGRVGCKERYADNWPLFDNAPGLDYNYEVFYFYDNLKYNPI